MLDHLSVEEIQKNINNRQISIKEVLVYYLERIEKFNKDINAIVLQKDRELLIKEAEQKDNFKTVNKILNGLPIAVKDLSDVVGLKTTYGYDGSKNNSPKKNSLFVDKLIDNGAIIIGKTNTAELGVGGHTTNRLFGPTSNVYNFASLQQDLVVAQVLRLQLDYFHLRTALIKWDLVEAQQPMQIFMDIDQLLV